MTEGTLNVLLVEDNPGDARLIRALLSEAEDADFIVTVVDRLAAGMDRVPGGGIDVTLLDLSLPDSAGLDTLRLMLAAGPTVPIIVLTGLDDRDMALQAMREGAQDYLVKGKIDAQLIARTIRHACERHRMIVEMRSLSLTDELTGLYNRRGFVTIAGTQLKLAARAGLDVAVTFIDLDGMKRINDSYGHGVGDQVLVATAKLLRSTYRGSDIVARIGGDEFVALAVGIDPGTISHLLDRLTKNLDACNAGAAPALSLSLGTAYRAATATSLSIDDLMAEADQAMYAQKKTRRAAMA